MPIEQLNPKIEQPFRTGIDLAGKLKLVDLERLLDSLSDEQLAGCYGLCAMVAAYTAIDVCGRSWPNDASLRKIASDAANVGTNPKKFKLKEQDVYSFLSRFALHLEPLKRDQPDAQTGILPFVITVNILGSYCPEELSIAQYLDVIEDAFEKAWAADLNWLPALMLRSRMSSPVRVVGDHRED